MTDTETTIWPADKVERRPIASLLPYANNARTHSPAQIAQLAKLIAAYGWTTPVLVDAKGVLIAGHGRILAAQSLGISEIPTMTATGWTAAQVKAYRLADNSLAAQAGWDNALLLPELAELDLGGFDMELTGFAPDALAGLLGSTEGLTDPDDVPEAPAEPVTVAGDMWVMGRHRLMCGDSTRDIDVSLALAGVRPHLMVTDPPYGVGYDPDWRNDREQAGAKSMRGAPGARSLGVVKNDDLSDWTGAWSLFPGDVAYVWHAGLCSLGVASDLVASGFVLRNQIIWVKNNHAISRGHYHWKHEPCWYAVRKTATGHWHGDRAQNTVWEIANGSAFGRKTDDTISGHSTQKPVECMKRPIENNSSPGQAVYDPFVGSGTTIIAAEMTGRACHAIELSPTYVDVAVLRWQNFSGQQATLERTGQTFEQTQTAAAREVGPASVSANG